MKFQIRISKFTIGDVVQLKSGGPEMTVSDNKNYNLFDGSELEFKGTIECRWFDGKKTSTDRFHQDMLDLLED